MSSFAADPHSCGEEFHNLGLYVEARSEFETVRKSNLADPAQPSA
jgi:hypothetical protein